MIVFADLMGREGMHGVMHLGATSGLADIISYNVVMSTGGYGSSALRATPRPLIAMRRYIERHRLRHRFIRTSSRGPTRSRRWPKETSG